MNILNVTEDDLPEIEQLALHLGRKDCLMASNVYGHRMYVCGRKKPTDREYYIIKTTEGLMVLMDNEAMNYHPVPVVGRFYWVKVDSLSRSTYLVKILESNSESFTAQYQIFENDRKTFRPHLDGDIFPPMEWKYKELQMKIEKADVNNFITL